MTKDGKIASHPLDSDLVLVSPELMMGQQATSVLLLVVVEETQTSVTVWSTVEWTR